MTEQPAQPSVTCPPIATSSTAGHSEHTITGTAVQSDQKHSFRFNVSPFIPPRDIREITVWAPGADTVALYIGASPTVEIEMSPSDGSSGWWRVPASAPLGPDPRYGFRIDGGDVRPDPRSTRLPDGVHELSALHIVDATVWTDSDWPGRPVAGAVLYELHIGTFTPAGTLDAAIERLDHLVGLGVDFVEVMPLNAVNGVHNWGYDGVAWYAVHEPYGGPDAFARFVDACHARGLGVVLDVVYNHLGPSGNYLPEFGPYLSEGTNSWGSALNLADADSDDVRDFIIGNALRWFAEFHVDALRLDAVHALVDHRAVHILEQLAISTDTLAAELGRPLSLIAESDLNDPRMITPRAAGGYGLAAQWDDDVHHAVHTAVSGERQGYYADFGSFAALAKVLRGGFFHDGTYSSFRRRHHGRPIPTDTVPASSLVAYTCNHDQIGNRAIGDRPGEYLDAGQLAIKAALVLLSPFTPMLFMGEEWAASSPFQFFTSHPEPELGDAVRNGRRGEFAEHGWDAAEVPDPQDPATFERSRLDWSEISEPAHQRMLGFYRDLIALRRAQPDLARGDFASIDVEYDEQAGWFAMHRGQWTVVAVLGSAPATLPFDLVPDLSWEPPTADDAGRPVIGAHNVVIGTRS